MFTSFIVPFVILLVVVGIFAATLRPAKKKTTPPLRELLAAEYVRINALIHERHNITFTLSHDEGLVSITRSDDAPFPRWQCVLVSDGVLFMETVRAALFRHGWGIRRINNITFESYPPSILHTVTSAQHAA